MATVNTKKQETDLSHSEGLAMLAPATYTISLHALHLSDSTRCTAVVFKDTQWNPLCVDILKCTRVSRLRLG